MYEGLKGCAFLIRYFRDHGITESELALYEFWNGYWGCSDTCPDEEGLSYAADRVKRIVNYREMTMEDILRNENQTPWAWPTAMHFEKLYGEPPKDNRDIWTILSCLYNGKRYLFGIGKEEAVITEDMRKNGSWCVYTFSDRKLSPRNRFLMF